MILHGIFIQLPRLLWRGLKDLCLGIHTTLVKFFGDMYWVIYWLICVTMFVPAGIVGIIGNIAGGVANAFTELWVWISPKAVW